MPFIDAALDAILNPDLAQRFTVCRRAQVVNDDGEPILTNQRVRDLYGSVAPASNNALDRLDSYQVMEKAITVVTNFPLRGVARDPVTGAQYAPDLVQFGGDWFIVRELRDWTPWGVGFVEATCTSIDLADYPPDEPA